MKTDIYIPPVTGKPEQEQSTNWTDVKVRFRSVEPSPRLKESKEVAPTRRIQQQQEQQDE